MAANLAIAFALIGLVGGGAVAAWGLQGREIGHGLAVLIGGSVAGISLVLLAVVVIIKFAFRKQRRQARTTMKNKESASPCENQSDDRSANGAKAATALLVTTRQPSGHYSAFVTPNPTWSEIEACIRTLAARSDKGERAYVSCEEEPLWGKGYHYLQVRAVEGGFVLGSVLPGDCEPVVYCDERFNPILCEDVETALRVVRYFAETGQRDPSVGWVDLG